MYILTVVGALLCHQVVLAQYGNSEGQYRQEEYNRPPPALILSHKQALNHDGNFKYLFTSDNGLAQGETIAPDGSRNGGYSYVDPTGRKISVKYTAGKEGFRIIEGDHLPKPPQPIAPAYPHGAGQAQPAAPSHAAPQYYAGQGQGQDDGQYRPQLYNNYQPQPKPFASSPLITRQSLPNAISPEPREIEYNDEPGKPHSFGSGYIFEFTG